MTSPVPEGDLPDWAETSIAAALRAAFARRAAAVPIPQDLRTQMAMVQRRHGSNRASARAVGVDEATWRRWLRGSTPKPATAAKLAQGVRQMIAGRIDARFRRVDFEQHMGRDTRDRSVGARALLYDQAADAQITRHVRAGHYGHAARAWVMGIRDDTYRDFFSTDGFADVEYGITVTRMDI